MSEIEGRYKKRLPIVFLTPHLRELVVVCDVVLADPAHARRETRLGIGVSCYRLDDGRIDWILSATRSDWSVDVGTRIASTLWPEPEVVAGHTAGVIHVIVGD